MEREITVDAVVENLYTVQEALGPALTALPFSPETRMNLEVAVEEIFLNIANYAYAPGNGKAVIRAVTDTAGISITFADSGEAFDPLAKPDPDTKLPLQERQIGGLGIYMVKQTMDSVEYARRDGQNILTIRKNLA